jgi:hypothetical protein
VKPITLNLNAIHDSAVRAALQEIVTASRLNDLVAIAQNYTITGPVTTTRTLNVPTATASQIASFVATLVLDLQKGGANRTG